MYLSAGKFKYSGTSRKRPPLMSPQVTQSRRFNTNIKENKTVKSYVTCSFLYLLGFWVVLEPFCFVFFDFLQSGKRKKIEKKPQNGSKTTQKPRRDKNEQVTYDLTVLFSLIFVLNLWDCVTCGVAYGKLQFERRRNQSGFGLVVAQEGSTAGSNNRDTVEQSLNQSKVYFPCDIFWDVIRTCQNRIALY